jgi:hypothetical protein
MISNDDIFHFEIPSWQIYSVKQTVTKDGNISPQPTDRPTQNKSTYCQTEIHMSTFLCSIKIQPGGYIRVAKPANCLMHLFQTQLELNSTLPPLLVFKNWKK